MTLRCIQKLCNAHLGAYHVEIIVVDNASTDGTAEAIQKLKRSRTPGSNIRILFIKNTKNLGFAAGNNRGIRQAKGKYILLLNSDVFVESETLQKQLQFMEQHSEYAASTCRVELPSGRLDPACHRGFPTPWASFTYFTRLERIFPRLRWFGQYHQGWLDLSTTHDIEVISGAFFCARRKLFQQIGLLDEGFFMYAEDIDLCMRIRQAGLRIAFYPETSVVS